MTLARPLPAAALAALALALAASASAGCAPCAAAGEPPLAAAPVARPASCRVVAAGEPLQAAVDAAAAGDALCLGAGRHPGPVVVRTALTLWGEPGAVIASAGDGTTVSLEAAGARLAAVTVDGSGARYDRLDAAVLVTADDVVVEGVTVTGAVYGLLVSKAKQVRVRGNHLRGSKDRAVGLRGDNIRLWETDDIEITDNVLEDGRDMVVWYSRRAHIRGNRVLRARYGTHFMYSHDSHVEDNHYLDVTVGVFVMYTRGVELRRNVIANAAGASGIAIGFKDGGAAVVADNLLVHDEIGIYLDATPQRRDERVEITGNAFRLCRTALVFHASSDRVHVRGNDFRGNEQVARVDGRGDALAVEWHGNYYDDYEGYDLDHDGVGDVPFELRSFANQLVSTRPELAFFHGTPALTMAGAAAHLDPLYRPKAVLVDVAPRMAPNRKGE